MPNFKIRRRKKIVEPPIQPPPVQEEKVDEFEETMSEPSEEMMIDAAMKELQVTPLQRRRTEPQKQHVNRVPSISRPQKPQYTPNTRPQYKTPTNVVTPPPNPARYRQKFQAPPRIPDQYTRKPTMAIQNPRSKTRRGGAALHFSSHYGAGGEHLDTQTKSVLLYNHCFG